jgi:hypothetical protein
MKSQQNNTTSQITQHITPTNTEAVLKNSESPTTVILAVTILITTLMGSVTTLVKITLQGMIQRPK